MIDAFAAALAFLWVVVLPGSLATRLVLPTATRTERLFAGIALGLTVMPVLCFAAAMALGTIVRPTLVISVAALTNLALALALRRPRPAGSGPG